MRRGALTRYEADAAQYFVSRGLMLDLVIELLQIANVVAACLVYHYPIEHKREFGPAMSVHR